MRAPRTSMSDRLITSIHAGSALSRRQAQTPVQISLSLAFPRVLPSPLLRRLLSLVTGTLITRAPPSNLSPCRYPTDQRSAKRRTPLTLWKSLILWKTSPGRVFRSSGLGPSMANLVPGLSGTPRAALRVWVSDGVVPKTTSRVNLDLSNKIIPSVPLSNYRQLSLKNPPLRSNVLHPMITCPRLTTSYCLPPIRSSVEGLYPTRSVGQRRVLRRLIPGLRTRDRSLGVGRHPGTRRFRIGSAQIPGRAREEAGRRSVASLHAVPQSGSADNLLGVNRGRSTISQDENVAEIGSGAG